MPIREVCQGDDINTMCLCNYRAIYLFLYLFYILHFLFVCLFLEQQIRILE